MAILNKNKYTVGNVDFDYLVNTYSLPLYLYANKKMRNNIDAEDIVQDCLVRLWEKRNKIEDIKSIKVFLYTIVRNECFNRLKSKNVLNYHDTIDSNTFTQSELDSDMENLDLITIVLEAIETLPPQYSRIMKLTAKGLKNSEIAAELNISESSVKVMKTRSFKKIKERFGNKGLLILIIYLTIK